jgi:hypothetical protein
LASLPLSRGGGGEQNEAGLIMSRLRRAGILAGSCLSATTLAAAVAVPAQARTTTGWPVTYRHHYGAPANFSSFNALAAPATDDAWAFGNANGAEAGRPVAVRWNGRRWRAVALPAGLTSTIIGASATSRSDIWAVSWLGRCALHWNGRSWSVAKRWSGTGELTGVTALSATSVWVFGADGSTGGLGTWHFNGRRWTEVTAGAASGIDRASALSAGDIWGIGSDQQAPDDSLVHFNGTRWTRVSAPALASTQFNDIEAISRSDIWAAGEAAGGQAPGRVIHWNGRSWQRVTVPWRLQANRVIPDGRGGLWLTASTFPPSIGYWVLHRSRTGAWTRTRIGASPSNILDLARPPGGTAVWGVGDQATTAGSDAVIYSHG